MAEIDDLTQGQGPGEQLASKRSDRGWTQEEVAEKLHLSATVIKKLEANQFDDQMPDAFARGYLRNYAKLLGIDQQEVIAAYSQLVGLSKVKSHYEPTKTVGNPSANSHSLSQVVTAILIAIPVIALLIWYFGREAESSELDAVETSSVIDQTSEQVSDPAQPVVESTNSLVETQSAGPTNAQQTNRSGAADEMAEQTQVPTGFVETAEAVLDFEFIDDVWVQVTDSNGAVLAVGLKTAGRRFEVSGVAPISVVLGKPNAVKISYNDTEVDLDCFPAASTARFTLNSPIACNN